MQLFFELGPYDAFHRQLWEDNLARWQATAPAEVRRVLKPDDADCIVETHVQQSFAGGYVIRVAPGSHYHRRPAETFAWDGSDQPTGRLPGLYCSLARRIFDPRRHRSFCYPYRYNEHIAFAPPADAAFLFGFTGSVTAPIRARLFATLEAEARAGRALLRPTNAIWGRIFTAETDAAKQRYFDDLRRCKFILCPRGNGLCSVRLFETLEAGRVPVILSDNYVLPAGIDWSGCAIRVPERQLNQLPALLASREAEWPAMAARARTVWERNFSDQVMLARLAAELTALRVARRIDETWMPLLFPPRILPHLVITLLKRTVTRMHSRGRLLPDRNPPAAPSGQPPPTP